MLRDFNIFFFIDLLFIIDYMTFTGSKFDILYKTRQRSTL